MIILRPSTSHLIWSMDTQANGRSEIDVVLPCLDDDFSSRDGCFTEMFFLVPNRTSPSSVNSSLRSDRVFPQRNPLCLGPNLE
jgi:hypothetical protein